jgi:hypothetical protein
METIEQKMKQFIPTGNCANCLSHKATIVWTNSSFEMVHGQYLYWCECCAIKAQIQHIEEGIVQLDSLKAELKKITTSHTNDCFSGEK